MFSSYLNGEFDVLPLEPRSIMQLDTDMKQAIIKMKKLNEIKEQLPQLTVELVVHQIAKHLLKI